MTIRTDNLTVRFPRRLLRRPFTALDGVSLEVREGDFFALLGQNGAGKTTAMHCLVGLLRPTAGNIEVLGVRPEPGAAFFSQVGYLPEEPRYHEYLTVEEAVTYYTRLSGVRPAASRVTALLDSLGLSEHRRLLVRRCSKGMKQKVGIAQAVIHEPRMLFLDEPMRGLDPMTVHIFRDMLVEMNRRGTTIVMNSHILSEVEQVATRAAIIHRGRLAVQDDVANLVRTATERYVIQVASLPDDAPYVSGVTIAAGVVTATLAVTDLYPFMDFARARDVRLLNCSIAKQTLEERFVEIVEGAGSHA